MTNQHIKEFYRNQLQPLKKGHFKQKTFVGFDVETYADEEGVHRFYTGGLWWSEGEEEHFKYFDDAKEMRRYIINHRFNGKTLIATNLSFDLTVLFYGSEYWNSINLVTRSGDIMQASYEFKQNNGKVVFLDTFNYCPFSVATLGNIIGIPKKKAPSWLGERRALNLREYFELKNYNKYDCMISCKFAEFLQRGINELGGQLKISSASTALDTYRRNYLPESLIKEEYLIGEWVTEFIFEGYYGGRTEVFSRGRIEDCNYYDVNNLYGSVMRNEYPLPQSVKKIHEPQEAYILDYEGVSEVLVEAPSTMQYPVLPLRTEGKLLFPTGTFRGTYNHVELRKALEEGYTIHEVHKQIIYTETFTPFKEYVETLYEKRMQYKEEGSEMEQVTKLLLNSLYGKWAQKRREEFEIIDPTHFTEEQEKKFYSGGFEGDYELKNNQLMRREEKVFRGKHSYPILASYTTSYARVLMYDYIRDYEALYTDTDSIITKHEIKESTELGKMKLEKHIQHGYLVRPKFYMLDGKPKLKGCSGIGEEGFLSVLEGESYNKQRFSKLRESFRRGLAVNTVIDSEKNLSLEDNKRLWNDPFSMEELQTSNPIHLEEEELCTIKTP